MLIMSDSTACNVYTYCFISISITAFTFRAFSRCFYPKRFTTSTFVRITATLIVYSIFRWVPHAAPNYCSSWFLNYGFILSFFLILYKLWDPNPYTSFHLKTCACSHCLLHLDCSNPFTWFKPFYIYFCLNLCGFTKTYFNLTLYYSNHCIFNRKCIL